jgi:hypothetical protein
MHARCFFHRLAFTAAAKDADRFASIERVAKGHHGGTN